MIVNRASYKAGMQQVAAEAAGVLDIKVLRQFDVIDALAAAVLGDREAAVLVKCVDDTVERIRRSTRREPALCGCCPRRLRGSGYAIGIATPHCGDPTTAFGFAICEHCAPPGADLHAKAIEAIRRLWPDARQIEITHPEGGRA